MRRQNEYKPQNDKAMIAIAIVCVLIILALVLNASMKLKSYNKTEKTLWEEGDSVRVMGPNDESCKNNFMTKLS